MRDLLVEHPKDLSLAHPFSRGHRRRRFSVGHGDLRHRGLSLSRGRTILLRSDLAGARARLQGDRLAHSYLFAARSLPPRGHPRCFEYHGNHLELAARIRARPQFDANQRLLSFNIETNKATYLAASGAAGPTSRSGAPGSGAQDPGLPRAPRLLPGRIRRGQA